MGVRLGVGEGVGVRVGVRLGVGVGQVLHSTQGVPLTPTRPPAAWLTQCDMHAPSMLDTCLKQGCKLTARGLKYMIEWAQESHMHAPTRAIDSIPYKVTLQLTHLCLVHV